MTKQEEIREGIKEICTKVRLIEAGHDAQGIYGIMGYKYLEPKVNEILSYLHSQGIVIKVDKKINGNMTNELYDAMGVIEEADCKILIKQALTKAGYVAVEPLVEEW